MPIRPRFEDMTSAELRGESGEALAKAVAVVPIAATEQHGDHLPLGTDAMIAEGMVKRLLARLDGGGVTVLPVQRLGTSDEHLSFPGTLSLDWRTGVETLLRIGEGLARAGFRRIAIVSSHGGNTQAMEIAALDLRRRFSLLCATASWSRFGLPAGLVPEAEAAIGIHGGAVETALMLAFRPELVRRELAVDRPSLQSALAAENRHLRAHGRLGFGWLAEDLNPVGTVGDARLADAATGEAIAAHQVAGFAAFLEDVARFDLARLAPPAAEP